MQSQHVQSANQMHYSKFSPLEMATIHVTLIQLSINLLIHKRILLSLLYMQIKKVTIDTEHGATVKKCEFPTILGHTKKCEFPT